MRITESIGQKIESEQIWYLSCDVTCDMTISQLLGATLGRETTLGHDEVSVIRINTLPGGVGAIYLMYRAGGNISANANKLVMVVLLLHQEGQQRTRGGGWRGMGKWWRPR